VLLAAVALKLVPVITTEVPTGPLIGANEVIVGCAKTANCNNKEAKDNRRRDFFIGAVFGNLIRAKIDSGK
jgi:hypothetical protein